MEKKLLERLGTVMRSIDRAESVALGSTAVAFGMTVVLAGSAYAVESNPLAASSIEALGWVGAGIVALLGEVLIIEGYRRVVAPRRPRLALVGSWSVASIGVLDVVANIWILSQVGLPETVSGRLLGAVLIVSTTALALSMRGRLIGEGVNQIRRQRANSRIRMAGAIALVAIVSIGGVAPTGVIDNPVDKARATPTSGDLDVAYREAGTNALYYIDSEGNAVNLSVTAYTIGGMGDMDGDGDIDVTYGDPNDNLKYIDKDGNVVDTGAQTGVGLGGVADIDGDGDLEVAYSPRSTEWLKYVDGSGDVTNMSVKGRRVGGIGDFDGDGDIDIVYESSASGLKIIDVNGNTADLADSNGDEPGEVRDIDGDGDLDVPYIGSTDNLVYEDASGNSKTLATNAAEAGGVGDIDGDGELEVAYESGTGSTRYLHYVDDSGNNVNTSISIFGLGGMGDIDGDGFSSNSGGDRYKQTFALDDHSGLFPTDRSTISVYEWSPGAKSLDSPSESTEWSFKESKTFNSQAEATFDLVEGDYYKVEVSRGGNSWEVLGYLANESRSTTQLVIEESGLIEPEATPTPGTPTPTRAPLTPYENGSTPTPYPTLTATEEPSAEGPAVLGRCEVSGGEGIEVEYWDPSYSTSSLDYNLTGPEGSVYTGSLEWEGPRGYYRGCIATTNGTAPEDVEGTYSGDYTNGTSYNGSLEWPDTSSGGFLAGGPTGSGGGGSTATQYGGWLILVAGGALAYRRFGSGQIGALVSTAAESASRLVRR